MDYQKHYDLLIEQAKNRRDAFYPFEVHHIKPKSWGGSDKAENLVKLTLREHFMAHLLLHKANPQDTKMMTAIRLMSHLDKYKVNSKMYEKLKSKKAIADYSKKTINGVMLGYDPATVKMKFNKNDFIPILYDQRQNRWFGVDNKSNKKSLCGNNEVTRVQKISKKLPIHFLFEKMALDEVNILETNCINCGSNSQHKFNCRKCNIWLCSDCVRECSECGESFCEHCYKDGKCFYCNDQYNKDNCYHHFKHVYLKCFPNFLSYTDEFLWEYCANCHQEESMLGENLCEDCYYAMPPWQRKFTSPRYPVMLITKELHEARSDAVRLICQGYEKRKNWSHLCFRLNYLGVDIHRFLCKNRLMAEALNQVWYINNIKSRDVPSLIEKEARKSKSKCKQHYRYFKNRY